MRCFVAVDVPREERVKIAQIQKRLSLFPTARLVPEDSMHITLEFFGELDDTEVQKVKGALQNAAQKRKSFSCSGKSLRVFPNPSFFRVICIELDCKDAMLSLQKEVSERIRDSLGRENPYNTHEFSPHITIARVNGMSEKKEMLGKLEALKESMPKISFEVSEIKLKESALSPQGAKYSDLGAYPLA